MKENTNTVLKNQVDNVGRFDAFVTPTLNTFYNDDCMNWLPKCPPNFFELAIVDPPYGINIANWDASPPDAKYFSELFRVSKNQIIWGGNYFDLPIKRGWIVWDKAVIEAGYLGKREYDQFELIWTSLDIKAKIIRFSDIGNMNGWNGKLKVDYNFKGKIHPTQKHVELYKYLLQRYAKAGDKILDTHAGSASCLVACKEMGFDYVGFEIDKEYWTIANERLGRAYYQPELFGRSG